MKNMIFKNKFPRTKNRIRNGDFVEIKNRKTSNKIYLLLLIIFFVGFFIPEMQSVYFILGSCINLIILFILRKEICSRNTNYLPIWLMMLLFVLGYVLKTYLWFLLPQEIGSHIYDFPGNIYATDTDLVGRSYLISCIGFLLFFIVSKILIFKKSIKFTVTSFEPNVGFIKLVLSLILLMSIVTGYFQYKYQIGIFGHDPVKLPFKLSGIIYESRNFLIPYLLLVLIHILQRHKNKKFLYFSIALLIVHAISQSFLITSRGIVLLILIPVFMLYILNENLNKKALLAFGIIPIVFVIATYTTISEIRSLRSTNGAFDMTYFINTYQESTQEAFELGSELALGRVIGINGTICSVKNVEQPIPLGELLRMFFDPENSFSDYYTHEILGIFSENHHSSPGLIGQMYVIGLIPGVIIGMIIWAILWVILWNYYFTKEKFTRLPLLSMVAYFLFLYSHEGDIGSLFKIFIWLIIFNFVGEYLFKKSVLISRKNAST